MEGDKIIVLQLQQQMFFKVIFKLLKSPSESAFTTNKIYLGETHLIFSRQMRDLGSKKPDNPSDQKEL